MPNNELNTSYVKPFRLVKFFTYVGPVVFLLFSLVLSWVISNHATRVLLERSEVYALAFARHVNHQVFQQFVLPTVLRYGKISLRQPEQYKRLDTIVRNITHGMKIESVSILDVSENITTYSTVHERIGKKEEKNIGYEKALNGESSSLLISYGSLINLLPGAHPISCQLKSYIPFRSEKPLGRSTNLILGVIEIVQDLSEDFEAIIRLQGIIVAISFVIMFTLFVVLQFFLARADRIIEARNRERLKLEEKLHQSERLASLGKMVASVSHEIKNPLGIVRSTAEILTKRLRSISPDNEHLAHVVAEETMRLDGVVREFLDFARPKTPKMQPRSVNEIVNKAIDFLRPEFEKNQIDCKLELEKDLPLAQIDYELLYRAFLNILLNSVQAMSKGGEIMVRSLAAGRNCESVIIEFSDNGPGMDNEKLAKIFNPFFTDKSRGTGLGLSIVKNIIDSHNGHIEAESEPGIGTTFRITLQTG